MLLLDYYQVSTLNIIVFINEIMVFLYTHYLGFGCHVKCAGGVRGVGATRSKETHEEQRSRAYSSWL